MIKYNYCFLSIFAINIMGITMNYNEFINTQEFKEYLIRSHSSTQDAHFLKINDHLIKANLLDQQITPENNEELIKINGWYWMAFLFPLQWLAYHNINFRSFEWVMLNLFYWAAQFSSTALFMLTPLPEISFFISISASIFCGIYGRSLFLTSKTREFMRTQTLGRPSWGRVWGSLGLGVLCLLTEMMIFPDYYGF